jgi:hypothetical protein
MAIKFGDSFEKIGKNEISALEQKLGRKLPESYKKMLLKHNGGRPDPNSFSTSKGEYVSDIQFFYGIISREHIYDLERRYDQFQDRLPAKYLAIAGNSGGDQILLDLDQADIHFFDHELEEIVFVSESFEAFLDSIYETEEVESEFDQAVDLQNISYFQNRIDGGEGIDDLVDEFDQTVAFIAAQRNKLKLLKFSTSLGASINKALSAAASNGHLEVVDYLLSLGADVNERDENQNNDTPLIQAAHSGHLDVVKILLAKGADITAKDEFDQTALDKAEWSDNDELVAFLKSFKKK